MSNPEADDDVMCQCSGTKRSDIKRLFLEGFDQDAISRKTGALSGCGGCEWEVWEFLHHLAEQQDDKLP